MRKLIGLTILTGLSVPLAMAQTTSTFTNDAGQQCTKTVDSYHNTAISCGEGNTQRFGSQTQPRRSAPSTNLFPDDSNDMTNGQQNDNQMQGAPSLASILVGKWHYMLKLPAGMVEAMENFTTDGEYQVAVRFPHNPILGQQVMVEIGQYQLNGATLITNPERIMVGNGPRQDRLCDVRSNGDKCTSPAELTQTRVALRAIDADTVEGSMPMPGPNGQMRDVAFTATRVQ